MKRKYFLPFLFILLAGVVAVASLTVTQRVTAQQPAPTPQPGSAISDNDVNRVAKKLYCPVCPNTPLDVCTTQACKDWRAQIREQLASGWTDQQVMDYFVKSYGERVLAEPERGGFTSLVWMLPVLVVLLGLILVWLILKSWRARLKAQPAAVQQTMPSTSAVPSDILAKIEAEIRKMD
jgi:cytochrome c-type biogenesis protein CcmH